MGNEKMLINIRGSKRYALNIQFHNNELHEIRYEFLALVFGIERADNLYYDVSEFCERNDCKCVIDITMEELDKLEALFKSKVALIDKKDVQFVEPQYQFLDT